MTTFTPDTSQITDAILATNCSPLALEEGSDLVMHWIGANEADVKREVMAVECGFVCWLDNDTVIVGVQDLLTREAILPQSHAVFSASTESDLGRGSAIAFDIIGNEWKTTGARSEADWLDDILAGSQIGIYALALHKGVYYEKGSVIALTPAVPLPRIRVRAIKKSTPPAIWPKREADSLISFGPERLKYIENALLVKAASIRAMRRSGAVPWQLPGIWCTNKYRRRCVHYDDCSNQRTPEGWEPFDVRDPAYALAVPHLGDRVKDPELVVLGASAYAAYSECAENGRRNTLQGNREESLALDTGSVLHAGVAEWYRQMREFQKKVDSGSTSQ